MCMVVFINLIQRYTPEVSKASGVLHTPALHAFCHGIQDLVRMHVMLLCIFSAWLTCRRSVSIELSKVVHLAGRISPRLACLGTDECVLQQGSKV